MLPNMFSNGCAIVQFVRHRDSNKFRHHRTPHWLQAAFEGSGERQTGASNPVESFTQQLVAKATIRSSGLPQWNTL